MPGDIPAYLGAETPPAMMGQQYPGAQTEGHPLPPDKPHKIDDLTEAQWLYMIQKYPWMFNLPGVKRQNI